jgi:hypothetical protein
MLERPAVARAATTTAATGGMHERMIAAMILALSSLVGPAALAGKEALAALGAVARRKIAETIGLTADVIVVFAKTIERSIGKAKRVLDQRSHS